MKLCHYSFCTFLALMGMCTTQDGESTTTRSSSVDQAARMVDVNDTLQKAADLLHNVRTCCFPHHLSTHHDGGCGLP